MAEISPHQGSESQWIEALLFLPISEILSLTWEIVVDPDYMGIGPSSSESRLFQISTDELSRELFPTSSFSTRHLGEPAGLTQRKESSLGQN